MKYSNYLGVVAALGMIVSCFLPWVHIASLDITLNGVNGHVTERLDFGRQVYPQTFFALLMSVFFIVPRIWAKRTNLLVGAIQISWTIKNYIVFTMCREGECPEKKIGISLLLVFSAVAFLSALLPKLKPQQ